MTRRYEPVPLSYPVSAAEEGQANRLAAEAVREVCDPVTAILISAEAAQRWLSGNAPNLAEARDAIETIIGNSQRAAEALRSVRRPRESVPKGHGGQNGDVTERSLMPSQTRQLCAALLTTLPQRLRAG